MVSVQSFDHFDRNYPSAQMQTALTLAKNGWPVFPLHYPLEDGRCSCNNPNCSSIGKHPRTANGFKAASTNENEIRNWWSNSPNANLGLVTGKTSGILVLDVDPRHGGLDSLSKMEKEYEKLPETLKVKTGGDGWHYYFLHPNIGIPNRANFLPGLDIRADGGYVVAPSSIHGSLKQYSWDDISNEILPIPNWLLDLIVASKIKQPVSSSKKIESNQNQISEGSRHQSMVSIGGFLTSKGYNAELISNALVGLNGSLCNPPLPATEIESICNGLTKYEEEPWPQLQEIPKEQKVPPLKLQMIPESLQGWCHDISERMQVPLEYIAGPAIVLLSSLIGRRVSVKPNRHDDWEVIPNLWGMIVAPPGSMKSPAIASVLKPLYQLVSQSQLEYQAKLDELKENEAIACTEIAALKDSLKSAVKQGNPQEIDEVKKQLATAIRSHEQQKQVVEKRYLTNDPTIEKLLTIMQENPQGVLLYRDEISGWLSSMSKPGREGDREFFLEAWNGDTPYTMDRIGRGSTFVDGLCLSVLGGLQPGKFDEYVSAIAKGGKADDGLLQRFQILFYPDRKKSWKQSKKQPDKEAYTRVEEIVQFIDSIPIPTRENNQTNRIVFRFTESAQASFDNWRESLEKRLCTENLQPMMESHLSKFRSLLPSLSVIFSIVDLVGSEKLFDFEINKKAVELAIEWCSLLELHAQKSFGEHLAPSLNGARHFVKKIQDGKIRDYDRCRDVYRRGWKGMKTADELENVLEKLKEFGIARTETFTPPNGGRSEVIRLNPQLR